MAAPDERDAGSAALLVLASAVLFGTTGTAQALGPEAASPATVGAMRIAVGGGVLVAAALAGGLLFSGRRWPVVPVALGAAGVAAYQVFFFAAVDRTGVALGTIVALGSAPAWAGLLAVLLGWGNPGRRWLVATGLAVGGAALLVASGGEVGVDAAGVGLALGAGAAYAVYTLSSKTLLDLGHPPAAVMAAAFGLGAVLLVPVLVVGDLSWVATGDGLAMVVYLGLIPTALAYLLFARGLVHLRPEAVTTLTLAEPLTAAVLGVAVLDERPSAVAVVGALLVLSGLVLQGRRRVLA